MPSVVIIAGGAGVSAYPDYFLNDGAIDFVLCGEAEVSLRKFMHEISRPDPDFSQVPNCAWKVNGAVRFSPLRAHTKKNEIEIALVKTAESAHTITLSTSLMRGCPKKCNFCSSVLMFGRKIRTPPLDRLDALLSSLSLAIKSGGKRPVINLEDDNLLCDIEFLRASMFFFKKHLPEATFIAENGLDYSLLTPERCEWLVKNGMSKFNLSLASTAPEILTGQGRFFFPERYGKTIEYLALKGLPSVTYFICGLKEDTLESTADNIAYLHKKQTAVGTSMFYAVPGLPDFEDRSRFERQFSHRCLGSAAYPWNNSLSTKAMITAFRLARYSNLKRSIRRTATEDQLLSIIEDRRKLYTILKRKGIAEVAEQDTELVNIFFSKLS